MQCNRRKLFTPLKLNQTCCCFLRRGLRYSYTSELLVGRMGFCAHSLWSSAACAWCCSVSVCVLMGYFTLLCIINV